MLLSPVEIKNAILMALGSLRANKFRAFLTVLGVMVGVSSVIGMASVVNGLEVAAEQEVDRMGSNIITVQKFGENVDWDNLTDEERNRAPITAGEAETIMKNCPTVEGVAPRNYYFQPGGNEARYMNRKFNSPYFLGTWPDYVKVRDKSVQSGRFLSEIDQQHRLMV
ncbi:MAG: ABC transporter permease, partial [Candidatus Zixiibacteriota bacterium]